jgi:hypothetical protein
MLSIGLWRWYINIIITILDIIHHPVFYLKSQISETGFCLRRFHLKTETYWNDMALSRRQEDECCWKCDSYGAYVDLIISTNFLYRKIERIKSTLSSVTWCHMTCYKIADQILGAKKGPNTSCPLFAWLALHPRSFGKFVVIISQAENCP